MEVTSCHIRYISEASKTDDSVQAEEIIGTWQLEPVHPFFTF